MTRQSIKLTRLQKQSRCRCPSRGWDGWIANHGLNAFFRSAVRVEICVEITSFFKMSTHTARSIEMPSSKHTFVNTRLRELLLCISFRPTGCFQLLFLHSKKCVITLKPTIKISAVLKAASHNAVYGPSNSLCPICVLTIILRGNVNSEQHEHIRSSDVVKPFGIRYATT